MTTATLTPQSVEEQLIDDIMQFTVDPLGFVMYSFDWGRDELKDYSGPEKWQAEILEEIGAQLKAGIIDMTQAIQIAVASGHGCGKLHAYDMILSTPSGEKRWGDISIGDHVFGLDGKPVKILQTHHFKDVPMYRVSFDDGSYCDVSSGHLWNVRGRQERRKNIEGWRTLETIAILELGVKRSNGVSLARQWEIPVQGAVEFEEREVDVHPYLMGVWLGDGSRSSPQYTKPYPEIANKIRSLGYSLHNCSDERTYYIENSSHLFKGGVFDRYSYERYIPNEYKYNTSDNRMALFQGLCDSDGEANGAGSIGYSTTSKRLAEDVIWLARSLGCKAMMQSSVKKPWYPDKDGQRVVCRDCYRITINAPFNPFTLEHRKNAYKPSEHRYLARWIESIEPIGNNDGMCITVENVDGLYLANDFIVTHNSALVSWVILWALSTCPDTKGIVTANTENQLKTKTWAELAKWHRLFIARHWFTFTATAIYSTEKDHEKTWRFDMIPWSENKSESFAGMHNKGKRIVVIMDEASAIPDIIWQVTEGALTDEDTQIIWLAFGNPTRNVGRFCDCFGKFRHRWIHKRVDSREVSITNKDQINEWIEDYGEDSDFVRIRVRGVFPRMSDHQFISTEVVESAMGRHLREDQYNFAARIIGVDRAWSGDETKVYLRQGLMSKKLGTFNKGEDDFQVAEWIATWEDEYQADAVFIDFGYGTGVYSAGKQMKREWRMVNFGAEPIDRKYLNKRVEMWGLMKEWLAGGGAIPNDDDLRNDLIAPEAFEVQTGPGAGRLRLESKDDMKRRNVPSPDDADALALTFAFPVKNVKQTAIDRLIAANEQRSYDPLGKFGKRHAHV